MKSLAINIRLIAFTVAILGLASLIAWAAKTSWDQLEALHKGIHEEESGSFRIADEFQTNIHRLNYTLVRFGMREAPSELARFKQQSEELGSWLETQKTRLTTGREREVLDEINQTYQKYLSAANSVIAAAQQSNSHQAMLDALELASRSSEPLLDLGSALTRANHEAQGQWIGSFRESVRQLQLVIVTSLFALLAVGVATTVFVYRQLIAPLRTQLAESRELVARQEKLASLGVLAAGVAHEIRNPLTAIKVRLFTLKEELSSAGAGQEDVEVISGEISRLERIVKDFLQFARPSEPKWESVQASLVVSEVYELMAPTLAKESVELKEETASSSKIRVDPSQLKQALINLVQNAAESIEGNGKVTLRVRDEVIALHSRRQPAVSIDVEDSGKGIPAEVQQRLFDPFFTTKEAGTGLGLSIAARIIERHSGMLKFQTRSRQGTTFSIILPAAEDDGSTQDSTDRR